MKRGTPTHPKTYELASLLGVRHAYALGYLELLFHFTAQYAPEGNIGRYSDKRIAAALEWPSSPARLVEALVTSGWVDRDPRARLVTHDWSDHADRSTLQRLARNGKMPIKRNQQDRPKVCAQSDPDSYTFQSQSLMPEPEPEPEPCLVESVPDFLEVALLPKLDQDFENFWLLFLASGKPLNQRDKEKAARRWVMIPDEQKPTTIPWAVEMMKTSWTDVKHTPTPYNALQTEGWTRVAGPRLLPNAGSTQFKAAELLRDKLRRQDNA